MGWTLTGRGRAGMTPSTASGERRSAASVQGDSGAALPAVLAVPEFDAFDDAALAGQIDGGTGTAGRNAIAKGEFFPGAIAEVRDHAQELDGAVAHAQLNGAELAIGTAYVNVVVIDRTVDVGAAEIVPMFSWVRGNADGENKQQCDGGCKIHSLGQSSLLLLRTESLQQHSPMGLDKRLAIANSGYKENCIRDLAPGQSAS